MEKTKKLYVVANAHLDTQWNWTIQDTIRDCVKNTLEYNFALMDKYPNYRMNFEGAFRYKLAKEYYPDLYEKLKGYYPLAWYGQYYYDLENYVPQKNKVKNFYSLCGTDKDGKITCIVTHYSENDRTRAKKVKLDFGREAKFEAYLVDDTHTAEKIRIPKSLEFDMKCNSFILLKEI